MRLEDNLVKIASGEVDVPPEFRWPETRSARYVFSVKEGADGRPWICLELQSGDDLPVLRGGFLGLELRRMDYDLARHIANALNEYVEAVTFTG